MALVPDGIQGGIRMKKVLLYSGGMDSWLIGKLWKPDTKIYVDIHGEYSEPEKARLPKDVRIVDFPFLSQFEQEDKYIPMRNLYFLMIGTHYGDDVCLGATAGDGGADKSYEFLSEAEEMISRLWADKKVQKQKSIYKSFCLKTKGEMIDTYIEQGGTIDEIRWQTFSCYTPENGNECMACYPCFRKFAMLYTRGAEYDETTKRKMWEYVKANVIPTKEQGGYDGTYYTQRGEESKDLEKCVEMLREEFEK